ncbi:hypothetical protein SSP531S_04210 [Streptomyces spongiicola]|uniref:Uncharacterized protein n=2 Tax=Streptomyces spongiicola TaxID=1690221 RepID=A0A388SR26_9ACTN|nr:hypothetical protein [Streptomyces spongiicola]GBP99026.1 hypothetical protein SSP531S_04210 [Streptomyces spongiicola]
MPTRPPDRGMCTAVPVLGGVAVLLVAAGAAAGAVWLVGAGVWALIAAVATKLVYRP